MHEGFHTELVKRFLNELDSPYRHALGDAKISVCFADGDQRTVALAESNDLVISPSIPILHIQAEGWGHLRCLNLLEDTYLKAAARAGFKLLSMCVTPIVGVAVHCQDEA